jgi:hypothetical protein
MGYNYLMMIEKGTTKMLKNSKLASVGDVIRAYDFKPMVGREDCFVEGEVVEANNKEHGYSAFKIVVSKEIFSGEKVTDHLVGKFVYVPHEVSFMEYEGRIINLSK